MVGGRDPGFIIPFYTYIHKYFLSFRPSSESESESESPLMASFVFIIHPLLQERIVGSHSKIHIFHTLNLNPNSKIKKRHIQDTRGETRS